MSEEKKRQKAICIEKAINASRAMPWHAGRSSSRGECRAFLKSLLAFIKRESLRNVFLLLLLKSSCHVYNNHRRVKRLHILLCN